ncbi:MAG: DUF3526 domain-containing protein [Saprospiraceae bacterium]|nr:DUF3526 domain-containing protein [Saprospiraceae bacterium]
MLSNITEDKQKGIDGHNPWNKEAKLLEAAVLKEYGVDSVQQLPFNFDAYRMQKGEEHEAEIYFKHYALLKQTYEQQSQTYKMAAALSPFLPTRFLSMAIARTDYQAHWDFADAAEKYRINMQAALNDNFAKNSTYGDWDYKADKSLWTSIPDFSYTPITMGEILERNSSNIVILFSWLFISFVGLWLAARKI